MRGVPPPKALLERETSRMRTTSGMEVETTAAILDTAGRRVNLRTTTYVGFALRTHYIL